MLLAVTPLPRPLTTPPVISTYLVGARPSSSAGAGEDMAARGREAGEEGGCGSGIGKGGAFASAGKEKKKKKEEEV